MSPHLYAPSTPDDYYLNVKIETGDISAQISADGTVTFSDPPPQFSKEDVDRVLQDAQQQTTLLGRLEMEMARSKDYLSKVRLSFFDTFPSSGIHPFAAFITPSLAFCGSCVIEC